MLHRRLVVLLVAGLLGYSALLLAFPRVNPAARWQQQLDRREASERARGFAAALNIDTTGWQELVSADGDTDAAYYLAHNPSPHLTRFLSPVITHVTLRDLKNRRAYRFALTTRGEVIEMRNNDSRQRRGPGPGGPPERAEPTPSPTPADPAATAAANVADRALAETMFARLLGAERSRFSELTPANSTPGSARFNASSADEQVKLAADVRIEGGKVTEAGVSKNFTQKFEAVAQRRRSSAMEALAHAGNVVIWPGLVIALLLYLIALARRQVDHRHTLIFLLIIFMALFVMNALSNFTDDFRDGFQTNNSRAASRPADLAAWGVIVLLLSAISFGAYALYTAGLMLSSGDIRRRSIDLELLVRGRLLTRPVLGSLAAALSAGGIIAAIPHLLAATHLVGGLVIAPVELSNVFVARLPALASSVIGAHFAIFTAFVFAAPALEKTIKRRVPARLLVFLIALIASCSVSLIYAPVAGFLLSGLLTTALLFWLYRRFGTLAVIGSMLAAQWACGAAALLAQPNAGLRASGWRALACLGLGAVAALVGYWRSREVQAEELTLERTTTRVGRAERERLQAEFGVARKAQQHMLPDAPPRVSGFRIAAVCLPSKDVGGDLYDFLPLPDGKLGVVVADVSGKGVPASLYMTLTKGLLESVTEERTDPGEILREVNRHLYEVCRKKMFVTLFLGVLDPAARTLTFARAGHNPTVHRSPSEQTTTLLTSSGMGLGLNGGKIFDKTLKVEQVRLQPHDKLFFYSDGITEAMNIGQDEYGEERLMQTAERADALDAEGACQAVMDDVKTFLGSNPPQDDQTLVVIEVTA